MNTIKLPRRCNIVALLEQIDTMDPAQAWGECNVAQVEAAGATAMFDAFMEALASDNPQAVIDQLHSDMCQHITDMERLEMAVNKRLDQEYNSNLIKPYVENGYDLTKLDIENSQNLTKPDIGNGEDGESDFRKHKVEHANNLKKPETESTRLLKNVETGNLKKPEIKSGVQS